MTSLLYEYGILRTAFGQRYRLLCCQLLAAAICLSVTGASCFAQCGDIIVPDDYPTIQEAIDAADPGDVVCVRFGVWGVPPGGLDFQGKDIVLRSILNYNFCTIDGGGTSPAFVFDDGETADCEVRGFTIRNCFNSSNGGAIVCDQSHPTFSGCRIQSNSTNSMGGAVFLFQSDSIFENCIFEDNQANSFGGAVYDLSGDPQFIGCEFTDNTGSRGGAVHLLSNADGSFSDCLFDGNGALSEGGGAAYIDNHSNVPFTDCEFSSNTATDDGGAVYVDRTSQAIFDGPNVAIDFSGNSAGGNGGAVLVNDGSAASFTDCELSVNVANVDGGAVAALADSTVTINQSVFNHSNIAGDEGGGLYAEQSTTEISNTLIQVQQAGSRGGAIVNRLGSLTLTDSNLLFNSAFGSSGGGIYNDEATSVVITNTVFDNNSVVDRGGAIFNYSCPDVLIDQCTFVNNLLTGAMPRGGGVSNGQSTVTVTNSHFEGNAAFSGAGMHNFESDVNVSYTDFVDNVAAGIGGGMFNGPGNYYLDWCRFTGNSAPTGVGGGLVGTALMGPCNVVVYSCEFWTNQAHDSGGGAHFEEAAQVELANVLMVENYVTGGSGGGLRVEDLSTVHAVNCTICDNSAVIYGGGVSVINATVDFDNSILWENQDSTGTTEVTGQIDGGCTQVSADYSCIQNLSLSCWGTGNIGADPLFVDLVGGDLRLNSGSPAIDTGDNAAVPLDLLVDLDGNPRIADGDGDLIPVVDMGVYELPGSEVVAPSQFNVLRGILISGDLSDVQESDDSYLKFNPGITLFPEEPKVWIEFAGSLPADSPSSLSVTMEASANTVGLTQTVEMFDWNSSEYEEIDARAASLSDSVVTFDLTANIADYVQSGTGDVKTRTGWRNTGIVFIYPWTISIDQVIWTVD